MPKVISNSTPLIALSAIDKLDLLKKNYDKIIVPEAVYQEITQKDNHFLKNIHFIEVIEIKNQEAKRLFQTTLHQGEVELMILADEIKSDLCIIDDYLARKYAKYLGLKITGTLGVLLKSKEKGFLKKIKPLIDQMIGNGIYIDNNLYHTILDTASEK